jgi:proteic killer suppression protein
VRRPAASSALDDLGYVRQAREKAVAYHLTYRVLWDYTRPVIRSFRYKALRELFETGSSRRVRQDLQGRALRRLDALDSAETLEALNVPGFNFHPLRGKPTRYSLHVTGPWCITFEWDDGEALRVDLEQYH